MELWSTYQQAKEESIKKKRFIVLSAESYNEVGKNIEKQAPDRFHYLPITWNKFPDHTDDITISGFSPKNLIANEHVLFLASFHNNDVTLSQFSVLIVLLQSFIKSLTIVLPYYSVGTMERVDTEGKVSVTVTTTRLISLHLLFTHVYRLLRPIPMLCFSAICRV